MQFTFHFKVDPIHLHVHNEQSAGGLEPILRQINLSLEKIMATQTAEAQRLTDLGVKLDKISAETTSLVEAVRALKDQAGQADPALTAAIDAVLGKADAIDGLVDDLAPNPTPTPDPAP